MNKNISKLFDFAAQHICDDSTEANIFIHGYSAGHSDKDRQILLGSIPETFRSSTNIFAFWPSNHYLRFDPASLLDIGTAGLGLVMQPPSRSMRFGLVGSIVQDRVKNFEIAKKRAEQMGAVLFIQLNEYLVQHHPKIETINLIGHSLGGRLVVSSLKALNARMHPRLKINDVLLMAAAVEVRPNEAQSMRRLIQGRLINAYSKDDWVLPANFMETCIGRNPTEHLENIEIDGFGHTDYWENLPKVLAATRFRILSDNPTGPLAKPSDITSIQAPTCEPYVEEQSMTLELKSPSDIYQRINDELSHIITSLSTASDDPLLNQAQSDARERLSQKQSELRTQLAELENNAEWSKFTIAFYGETGAGKSTLIDTLRILLQEPSKRESQQKFRQLKSQFDLNEENLQQLQQTTERVDTLLDQLAQQLRATHQQYEQPHRDAEEAVAHADRQTAERTQQLSTVLQQRDLSHDAALSAVTRLQTLLAERQRTASFWQKLLNLFRKMPEEIALGQAEQALCTATSARDSASTALNMQQDEARQNRLALEQHLNEIRNARDSAIQPLLDQQSESEKSKSSLSQQLQLAEGKRGELLAALEKTADGEIIGDGRADFTRQTQRYDFELDGLPFALLDVPGIEGKEGLVLSEITRAVQTAHAVFYVTNQAAPPQTGDKEREGTLEKIKKHLGAQTEVWTIFNKKIANPKHSLTGRPLTSDDENASLSGLDEKMREQLGAHYREVFPLTALPAFLASTDHFVPGSQDAARRSKALETFGADELLEKSRVRALVQLLSDKLLRGSKEKITRANFNKAKEALDQTLEALSVPKQSLSEASVKLDQEGKSAKSQLNSSFQSLKQRLGARGETLIDEFSRDVRNNIYERIEHGISNDDFKDELRDQLDRQQRVLSQKLPEMVSTEVGTFQRVAEQILEDFQKHVTELTASYEKLGAMKLNEKFDLKIKINSGVNLLGLLTGLAGLAAAPFTGGASLWVTGAAIASLLASLGKFLWGLFTSKKAKQREAANNTLHSVTEQLRDSLHEGLSKALPQMQKTISQIELALEAPAKQAAAQVKLLDGSTSKLKALSRQIEIAGNL
jgi:ABC-type lipoprotein export system ATPase subunit